MGRENPKWVQYATANLKCKNGVEISAEVFEKKVPDDKGVTRQIDEMAAINYELMKIEVNTFGDNRNTAVILAPHVHDFCKNNCSAVCQLSIDTGD